MEKENLKRLVFKAASTLPVTLTEEEADSLVARVVAAKPHNPQGYAYVVARNFAISKMRSARRASLREVERLQSEERERHEREEFALAKDELLRVVAELAGEVRESQLRHLGMVVLSKLERLSDGEIATRFPGTKQNQRHQWTRRGVMLVWPRVSERVRRVILSFRLQGGEP